MDTADIEHSMAVIVARRGEEIADQVVPAEVFVAVMAVFTELQGRVHGLELVLVGRLRGGWRDLGRDKWGWTASAARKPLLGQP
jgi:hypothetical protein